MGDTVGTDSGIFVAFGCDVDEMTDGSAQVETVDRGQAREESGGSRGQEPVLVDDTIPDEDPTRGVLPDERSADEAPDPWRDREDLIHGGCDVCVFCGGKNGDHSPECLDLVDSTDAEGPEAEYSPRCFCEFCGLCSEEAQASIASLVPTAPQAVLVTQRVPRCEGETEIEFFIRVMEEMDQRWVIGTISAFNDEGRATCPLMWPL